MKPAEEDDCGPGEKNEVREWVPLQGSRIYVGSKIVTLRAQLKMERKVVQGQNGCQMLPQAGSAKEQCCSPLQRQLSD